MQGFPPHVNVWLRSRGITTEAAVAAGLVWDGRRLGIPITKADGTRFYKWRRDPATDRLSNAPPKYQADVGGGRTLYRAETMRGKSVVVVSEGELDALRLSLEWPNVACVSSTTGASNFDEAWAVLFADKMVLCWFDADDAGKNGSRLAANIIAPWADSVWIVEHDAKIGKDITDVCQKLGRVNLADILASRGPFFVHQLPARSHDYKNRDDSRKSDGPRPPIIEVMERRYGVKLKKVGREFMGCCPVHNEKTPSMSVNAEKGLFNCHACSASGDAYSLIMEMEDCDFRAAKKIIDEEYAEGRLRAS